MSTTLYNNIEQIGITNAVNLMKQIKEYSQTQTCTQFEKTVCQKYKINVVKLLKYIQNVTDVKLDEKHIQFILSVFFYPDHQITIDSYYTKEHINEIVTELIMSVEEESVKVIKKKLSNFLSLYTVFFLDEMIMEIHNLRDKIMETNELKRNMADHKMRYKVKEELIKQFKYLAKRGGYVCLKSIDRSKLDLETEQILRELTNKKYNRSRFYQTVSLILKMKEDLISFFPGSEKEIEDNIRVNNFGKNRVNRSSSVINKTQDMSQTNLYNHIKVEDIFKSIIYIIEKTFPLNNEITTCCKFIPLGNCNLDRQLYEVTKCVNEQVRVLKDIYG